MTVDHGDGLMATITCPLCGAKHRETIPENACQFFYRCPTCDRILRPKEGDCCVFCSYSDTRCPTSEAAPGGAGQSL